MTKKERKKMGNRQLGFIVEGSKKPNSSGSERSAKPVGRQRPDGKDKPNPNYVPPASGKKSE